MGSAASSEAKEKIGKASVEDIQASLKDLSADDIAKVKAALEAPKKDEPELWGFKSKLPDCCAAFPKGYKVMAELPGQSARIVEMTMAPGEEDVPHDHPGHSMYFVQGGKLTITDYDEEGKSKDNAHEVEIPSGAPPIFPPGAHQVKNTGDTTVKVIFVETTLLCQPCAKIEEEFISPFKVAPQCYQILAENEEWITGMMTMDPGAEDPVHHHKDHLIYVLEGEEITIYPGGDKEKPMVVPLQPNTGIPAPQSAPPFGKHFLKNSGKVPIKMLFFERKV